MPHLDARDGLADGPDADVVGGVQGRAEGDLGLAVALGDRQPDAVEPAQQVGVDRGRARREDAGPVEAQLVPQQGADRRCSPVGGVLARLPHPSGRPPAGRRGRGSGPAARPAAAGACEPRARMDSWNFSQTRGTAKNRVGRQALEVVGHGAEAAGEPGLPAAGDLAEVADRPLGDVAERQEGEEPVGRAQVDERRQAPQRRHDVGVGDHRSLRRSCGAARVHEGGQGVRGDGVDHGVERPGFCGQHRGARPAQLVEVVHEPVVGPVQRGQDDDALEPREVRPPEQHLGQLVAVLHEAHPGAGVRQHVGDLAEELVE